MGREGKPYVTAAEYAARLWPNQTNGEIKVKYLILILYFISVSHLWCEHFLSTTVQLPRHRERWKEGKETFN